MMTRSVLTLCVLLHAAVPNFGQSIKSVEGIRISQIDGNVQLDSLISFSETYHRSGRLISRLMLVEQPNIHYIEETFNENLDLIKEEKQSPERLPIETIVFEYDAPGKPSMRYTYRPGGDTISQVVRSIKSIDDLIIKIVCYTPPGPEGPKLREEKYLSYDQENRVSYTYMLHNGIKTQERFFTYNEEGQILEERLVWMNPSYSLKNTYKYKKGLLVQNKRYLDGKLTAVIEYHYNQEDQITFTETTFPKRDELQTTYYQRTYWEPESPPAAEVSRGDTQTAIKP